MPEHTKPKNYCFLMFLVLRPSKNIENHMFFNRFLQKPLIFIAFQWFLRAATPETLKTNGFFGFLCSGIGKTLKTNGFFGFNGFSGISNSANGGLSVLRPAGQPASQPASQCRSTKFWFFWFF